MSAEVMSTVWDTECATPLEKLILVWIADSQHDFSERATVNTNEHHVSLARFTGANLTACRAAIKSLSYQGVISYIAGHVAIIEPSSRFP